MNFRNKYHILSHKEKVPEKFAATISLSDHQKAADYNSAKSNLSSVSMIVDTIVLLAWTIGGGLSYLRSFEMKFMGNSSPIILDLVLIILFMVINFIVNLPFSLYQTFILEEKFGFNKTTFKLFLTDIGKVTALFIVLGLPLIYALIYIMNSLGTLWWFYAFAFMSLVQLLMLYIYPTFIAPLFNKFKLLEDNILIEKVEILLKEIGFSHSGIYVMDASTRSSHGNAYFTGFGKNKRIVFFDTLLHGTNANESLQTDEVIAILAHELGHYKLKHVFKGMILSFILSFVGFFIFGKFLNQTQFFYIFKFNEISNGIGIILFTLLLPLFTFYLTPIFSLISRKHEFEADDFASKHAKASDLISSLVKMYKDNASSLTPDPLYAKFYYSHPPALIRIEHLEKNIKN
ncbi:MAG: M48 family metallopeptidase [Bacteriovoracaceae bacterium]